LGDPWHATIADSLIRGRSDGLCCSTHAFAQVIAGIFGEFENVGVTIGPMLRGLAWSRSGIQSAFYVYAVAALFAALIAAVMVDRCVPDRLAV
jgi:predicted MFS family arabinose efflux permease